MGEIFNGMWTIDLAASTVWDDVLQCQVTDEVGQEIITLKNKDSEQDYEVMYGDRPQIRMGYKARFDDPLWVPYSVREIIASANDGQSEINDFKKRIKASQGERERNFEVGKAYGIVRLIYVDELTHYRVSKNPNDLKAQSIMLRRMAEDGQSYMATVLDIYGIVYRVRRFVRV